VGADDFHKALRKAIRSKERFDEAERRATRSSKLTIDTRDLIETSRELVRQARERVARRSS